MAVAGVRAREEAAVRADAVLEHDPLAAALLALAAGPVVERVPVDPHAVARLGDLGRAVERVPVDRAEHRAVAVPRGGAAPPAELRFDDGEVLAGVGVRPADEGAADRAEVAGGEAV